MSHSQAPDHVNDIKSSSSEAYVLRLIQQPMQISESCLLSLRQARTSGAKWRTWCPSFMLCLPHSKQLSFMLR